jgi:hypothetical protein
MTRRELLRLGGSSLLLAGLARSSLWGHPHHAGATHPYLFLRPEDLPRITANAKTPLLAPMFAEWQQESPADLTAAMTAFEKSGNIVRDFGQLIFKLERSLTVQLVTPSAERLDALLDTLERIITRPYWDYFRDGGTEVIGIQRASFATVRLLYAREVLADELTPEFDRRILDAIAEKGCVPCYRTVYDMDHPDTVRGWDFDPEHAGFYDISMERWPTILGANNLRAAPTGALGLGALALRGHDPRAEQWLNTAVASTERFFKLFAQDGSFFEGLSYLDYSMRTSLPFIEAHARLIGDVDWQSKLNLEGMVDYIMTMQMGRTPEGDADIVNFSDARRSVFPGWVSRVGDMTGNGLAYYAADYAGSPYFFYDFLWYQPSKPKTPPPAELLNHRNDYNWIICRSGWEPADAVLAFKSGGPANHEHADRNHITFKYQGERILQDHFGAAYDRRHDGWKMRHTAGHNAVLIDGHGHHYVDGIEGTNDSKAYANILDYQDHGDVVWWTSDATSGYIVENYHVTQVQRSVIYAKPGAIIVFDQVHFRYRPQTVDARFFPDQRDGQARLHVDGNRFTLARPAVTLHGLVASDCEAAPRLSRLDVKPETGDFPCVEVHAPIGLSHHIVTVMSAEPNPSSAPAKLAATRTDDGSWSVVAPGIEAHIQPTAFAPNISVHT